jgi:antitoxin (DNA-binding transcriptional repressor) of toxin-antitoxin stability system
MIETNPAVYTLADLIQDTARIMTEIEEAGKPAFITRRGRFVALITPLAPGEIEAPVLAAMAREIGAQLSGQEAAATAAAREE